MGPETQAYITGTFTGQKAALMLLVKVLHKSGALNAQAYINALKATFNEPDAKFEKQSYEYLRDLASALEEEIATL